MYPDEVFHFHVTCAQNPVLGTLALYDMKSAHPVLSEAPAHSRLILFLTEWWKFRTLKKL
jgi:hypothetical protein